MNLQHNKQQLSAQAFKDILVAHRGWQNRHPENSYAGIKAALELGIQHIEIDVHLTADFIPVLCHDHHLMRLCEHDSDVRDCTLSELQALSFHEASRLGEQHYPTQVITLYQCSELIKQYPKATLYVEIKRKSLYHFGRERVLKSIHDHLQAAADQARLISFDIEVLQLAQEQNLTYPLIPVLLTIEQLHSDNIANLNPSMVFCDVDYLDAAIAVKPWPFPIVFYEITHLNQALSLIEAGAAGIETFCCGELIEAFQAKC